MTRHVAIVGAGIVGICTALSLRERGMEVTILDKGHPGGEASFGNAGVISPWSIIPQALPGVWKNIPGWLLNPEGPVTVRPAFWPRMVPWGLRFLARARADRVARAADAMEILCGPSVDMYRMHLAGTGHEDLVVDSFYIHAFRDADKARLDAIDYRIRAEKGADLELVGAEELSRFEPALSRAFKAAVVIKGQARARSPGRIAQVLMEKAVAQGARFVQAEVTGLVRQEAGWCLNTSQGPQIADKVVLAAGVWSRQLLAPLGLDVPLVAERGYHVAFADPGASLSHSVMDVDAKIVASSMEGAMRFAGGAEFGDIDAPPDPRKAEILTKQASAMIPDLNTANRQFWMGRRPSFPDSLPVLGEIPGQDGLIGAFGHSHYGLMMAPATGRLVADIAAEVPINQDLTAFSASRF